ncbi:Uncharacterized protein BP5553_01767 [Venustampulla echinocandica]|uniref:Uncharacterized protein n=1 Tax=Venustampulla echinocandica TaxID=2656787 RepID=A0A370U1Y7_9HELO|nr:Uncharacterized protein BP5553_01767 [Venustampulla echinocandica]RDL41788.1 Uncharacterized protein BP5553_01767 [Venustampulla echinocandica]
MQSITALLFVAFCIFIITRSLVVQKSWQQWKKQASSGLGFTKSTSTVSSSTHKETLLKDTPPYIFPPIRPRTALRTSMGLRRLEVSNWLTIDKNYNPEHGLRVNLLSSHKPQVIQCLPGSEEACHEVLSLVVDFLTSRFPQHFTVTNTSEGRRIYNSLTNETFVIGQACPNPLEVAARLAMEDFTVLMKDANTGEYRLQASATLFPAGWKLQERIGMSMAKLHGPVPKWKEQLSGHVNRYFDHLTAKSSMERTNLFIQTTPDLFVDGPEMPRSPSEAAITPSDLWVRRERQIFRRLERCGAVLFTVRTYMQRLVEVEGAQVEALKTQVEGWDEDIMDYKGSKIWGETFREWCAQRGLGVEGA